MSLIDAIKKGDYDQVYQLIKTGNPNLEERDISYRPKDRANGETPLMIAITHGCNFDIVKLLISAGAKINNYNHSGFTPLHFAVIYNCKDIINYLIDKKAELNAMTSGGVTPLGHAVMKNNGDIFDILISHGANPNCVHYHSVDLSLIRVFFGRKHIDFFDF